MTSIRERQEQFESLYLAPWASRAADSRGREAPEPPDPVRTAFQRDRDRILHSKSFRRLKHKTQVFIDPEDDHFRTRLTHTLEVAQVARTVARALRLNEDLTEAIALAHDLGHPPFGHAGEEALNAAYKEFVPSAEFKHHEHSLRVVEVLEQRTGELEGAHRSGLNLTWEVRDGIAHHSKGRMDLSDTSAEAADTLEGAVVRIADRVAYVNHDIDDAIRAGVIRASDLPREATDLLGTSYSDRIATMVVDIATFSSERPVVEMSPKIRAAADLLKEYLFETVYWNASNGAQELRKAQHVIRALFRLYMEQPELMNGQVVPTHNALEARAQAVCDYVAGMTDRYAISQFEQHFIPRRTGAETLTS